MVWWWGLVGVVVGLSAACPQDPPAPCPPLGCYCHRVQPDTVLCCHIANTFVLKEGLTKSCIGDTSVGPTHLFFRNYTVGSFEANSSLWDEFDSISFSGSRVGSITGNFTSRRLGCLNMSRSEVDTVGQHSLVSLPKLHTLDLSHNNFSNFPFLPNNLSSVLTLSVFGTSVNCMNFSSVITSLKNSSTSLKFLNYNESCCVISGNFKWFTSTLQVPLQQVEFVSLRLQEICPKGPGYRCKCGPLGFDLVPGKPPSYSVFVDCSGRNLSSLPPTLPPNTIRVNVSNNNITSLDQLFRNSSYMNVREFYADNNNIENLNNLEASHFIRTYVALSLKGNKLKSIPIYLLSSSFDRNSQTKIVSLGGNKLSCDCITAQVVKPWLMTNSKRIPDYTDILCENGIDKVYQLSTEKLCLYPKNWVDYIFFIIGGEVVLLMLLFSKVFYDYWVFKTAGYLPWPASKMPKLPCDWVFE